MTSKVRLPVWSAYLWVLRFRKPRILGASGASRGGALGGTRTPNLLAVALWQDMDQRDIYSGRRLAALIPPPNPLNKDLNFLQTSGAGRTIAARAASIFLNKETLWLRNFPT